MASNLYLFYFCQVLSPVRFARSPACCTHRSQKAKDSTNFILKHRFACRNTGQHRQSGQPGHSRTLHTHPVRFRCEAFLMNLMSWPKNSLPFSASIRVVVCDCGGQSHNCRPHSRQLSGDNRASNAINIYGIF